MFGKLFTRIKLATGIIKFRNVVFSGGSIVVLGSKGSQTISFIIDNGTITKKATKIRAAHFGNRS